MSELFEACTSRFITSFGWRSTFLVNVPTGAAFGLTAWIVCPLSLRSIKRFDWKGPIASAVALGAICFVAIELPAQDMTPAVWLAGAAACISAALWVAIEQRSRDPMVPLDWFRNPIFTAMNISGCLVYAGYFGMIFALYG
ncbi:TPA: hypothetical protein MFB66_004643 [Klebsiella pneumoniae]|uniref:hypothetical protein n=1 Tax=Enterobacterales TaxID=91347 RepID=UPI000B41EF8D|nr:MULTISPECIES: hypothetical protein [Klebsiella]HBM3091627.1 hypothetical protein [Klebsiella michiganensis]EKV1235868.1 hypothetical protein [Klebsiella pneumoniae]EKY0627798.1 hypothetical protein [Klebsiella pneumoniae]EKY0644034.1 hypothetical protein [Klebsiella pneumoniae]EKY0655370.1 hypothetical protein [Klebsiella pneumoniae]